jgi:hypothetical protein
VITEHSQQNLQTAFHRAVRTNLVRESDDVCDIASADIGTIGAYSAQKLLLITLSTFVFRLMIIFRIAETPATLAYYTPVGTAQTLDDVFAELANMCCGTLNRELSISFPHLAMSTPRSVSGQCIAFLSEMKPQYVASYRITINQTVRLEAALCLCCSAPVTVADTAAAAHETVSELEMF